MGIAARAHVYGVVIFIVVIGVAPGDEFGMIGDALDAIDDDLAVADRVPHVVPGTTMLGDSSEHLVGAGKRVISFAGRPAYNYIVVHTITNFALRAGCKP